MHLGNSRESVVRKTFRRVDGAIPTLPNRVHQIFEMQITNHHMVRERVEITKMNFKYFYSVSST